MSFSFSELKTIARRAVHGTMAVAGTYLDEILPAAVAVRVRCHNRITRTFAGGEDDHAEFLSSVDRLVFSREELTELDLTLTQGGLVTIPEWGDAVFSLDQRDPYDGPVTETWTVVRRDDP